MLQQQNSPGQALSRWVHSFRRYQVMPGETTELALYPGTGAELWLVLPDRAGQCSFRQDTLIFQRGQSLRITTSALNIFSIRLRAGALACFTDQTLSPLIDQTPSLQMLWHDLASEQFIQSVHCCPEFDEQCQLAERFLQTRLRSTPRLDSMLNLAQSMYENCADFVIGNYAAEAGQHRSHVSRLFRETQGVSAKHFHRLCRFERFLRDALFAPQSPLADLSLKYGYYDQAHMQHEVKLLTGLSAKALLRRSQTRLFYAPRTPQP